jgi:predicted nucleic acid-binding protein
LLEIGNALRLKRHRKELTESQLRGALRSFRDDVESGFLQVPEDELQAVYREAELLSASHTVSTGARSLDVLHVAAALVLKASEFVSLDRRQRLLASRAGLKVLPGRIPGAT